MLRQSEVTAGIVIVILAMAAASHCISLRFPCNQKESDSLQESDFLFLLTIYCPAPSVSNNATAAMLMAIVVIQPTVLFTRPLTLLFMIDLFLPISMIITNSGGATIPFNTAV
jgi:hypothetical protein